MRLIDADALMKVLDIAEECEECKHTDGIFCGKYDQFSYACGAITNAPTVDAVEVVRCKDCKHFEYNHPYIIQGVPVLGHEVCNAWGDGCKTDENGYCFMAERRTDETD